MDPKSAVLAPKCTANHHHGLPGRQHVTTQARGGLWPSHMAHWAHAHIAANLGRQAFQPEGLQGGGKPPFCVGGGLPLVGLQTSPRPGTPAETGKLQTAVAGG